MPDTLRVTDVTERFFSFSCFFATFAVAAGAAGKDKKTMKEKEKKDLLTGIGFLGAFILWTILIQCIDVREVGPNGTKIGFAAFSCIFKELIS